MVIWEANTEQVDSPIHSVPYSDSIGFLETVIEKIKTCSFSKKEKTDF